LSPDATWSNPQWSRPDDSICLYQSGIAGNDSTGTKAA
jgi:hypothetical protein